MFTSSFLLDSNIVGKLVYIERGRLVDKVVVEGQVDLDFHQVLELLVVREVLEVQVVQLALVLLVVLDVLGVLGFLELVVVVVVEEVEVVVVVVEVEVVEEVVVVVVEVVEVVVVEVVELHNKLVNKLVHRLLGNRCRRLVDFSLIEILQKETKKAQITYYCLPNFGQFLFLIVICFQKLCFVEGSH